MTKWPKRDEYAGKLCVRAREPGAIEKLRKHVDGMTAEVVTPSGDYRYRAWIEPDDFAAGMEKVARTVTYTNFKDAVLKKQGKTRYEHALHAIWNTLSSIQPGGAYGWGNSVAIPEAERKAGLGPARLPKLKGTKKSRSSRLPSFGGDGEAACEDCGKPLTGDEGSIFAGRWLCREVSGCIDRKHEAARGETFR